MSDWADEIESLEQCQKDLGKTRTAMEKKKSGVRSRIPVPVKKTGTKIQRTGQQGAPSKPTASKQKSGTRSGGKGSRIPVPQKSCQNKCSLHCRQKGAPSAKHGKLNQVVQNSYFVLVANEKDVAKVLAQDRHAFLASQSYQRLSSLSNITSTPAGVTRFRNTFYAPAKFLRKKEPRHRPKKSKPSSTPNPLSLL